MTRQEINKREEREEERQEEMENRRKERMIDKSRSYFRKKKKRPTNCFHLLWRIIIERHMSPGLTSSP